MKRLSYLFIITFFSVSASITAQLSEENKKDKSQSKDFSIWLEERIQEFVNDVSSGFDHWNKDIQFKYSQNSEIDDTTLAKKSSDTTTSSSEKEGTTFEGDTTISKGQTFKGNIIIKGGTLTVEGTIDGDVLVIGGDLIVAKDGYITGNAKVVGGEIVREEGSKIDGNTDVSRPSTASQKSKSKEFKRSYRLRVPWIQDQADVENAVARYNRVEGVFIGFGSEKKYYWDGARSWSAHGSIGYGFSSHFWRGNAGLSKQFIDYDKESKSSNIFEIGIDGYNLTDSKDQWLINLHENSLAAILLREDWRDYFQRDGYTIYSSLLRHKEKLDAQLKVAYLADSYSSLKKNTEWSIFGTDEKFRENDSINTGKMRSFQAIFGLNAQENTSRGQEGWSIYTSAEFASKMSGGQFSFNQYVVDIRRYQPLGFNSNLNIRVRGGTSEKSVPLQKQFEIGGIGTLPAYPYKYRSGSRMILANAELIVGTGFFKDADFWLLDVLDSFTWITFSDAGWVSDDTQSQVPYNKWNKGFEKINWDDFAHNFGVGIANRSGSFRFGYAWRTTDRTGGLWFLRITRPF